MTTQLALCYPEVGFTLTSAGRKLLQCPPVGRLDERIVQHGRKFAPEDIERTIGAASPALDPVRGVVFPVEIGGRERIVAVHEVRRAALREPRMS